MYELFLYTQYIMTFFLKKSNYSASFKLKEVAKIMISANWTK